MQSPGPVQDAVPVEPASGRLRRWIIAIFALAVLLASADLWLHQAQSGRAQDRWAQTLAHRAAERDLHLSVMQLVADPRSSGDAAAARQRIDRVGGLLRAALERHGQGDAAPRLDAAIATLRAVELQPGALPEVARALDAIDAVIHGMERTLAQAAVDEHRRDVQREVMLVVVSAVMLLGMVGAALSVDRARVAAQSRLLSTAREQHSTLQTMGEAVLRFDTEGRLVMANAAADGLFGEPLAPWLGRTPSLEGLVFRDDRGQEVPRNERALWQVLRSGLSIRNRETRVDLPGRGPRWLRVNGEPLREGPGGAVVGAVLTMVDVTEERRREAELQAHRADLEALVRARTLALEEALRAREAAESFAQTMTDHQPTLLSYWDDALVLRFANAAFLAWFGLQREVAIGRPLHELLGPDQIGDTAPALERLMAGRALEAEVDLDGAAGRHGHFWTYNVPDRRAGRVAGIFSIATDVSELHAARLRAEAAGAALAETSTFLQIVADTLPAGVVYYDRQRLCRFVNRPAATGLRRLPEQMIGQPLDKLFDADYLRPIRSHVERAFAGETGSYEWQEVGNDGRTLHLRVRYMPDIRDGELHGVLVMSTDVTELVRAGSELSRANEALGQRAVEAEAATRAKSAFLANMSHEIRTPINAILGLSHLMRRDARDERQIDRLHKLDAAARHLLQIVNDVLDLSKIEAGKRALVEAPFRRDDLVQRVLDIVSPAADAKGLDLVVNLDHLPVRLIGDADAIAQGLLNLVGNAVKFTDRGWVRLSAHWTPQGEDAGLVRFDVTDTGPGVAADHLPRLFDAFEQADNSSTRRHGGTGLGLAITRRLARLMGGEVGADSVPGEGSRFWFSARLALPPADPLPAPLPLIGQRVLLVDALESSRAALAEHLGQLGLDVTACRDGRSAVEHAERALATAQPIDLLVIDWRLPDGDGAQVLQRLRGALGDGLPPAVLMSAHDDDELWRAAGAARFGAVLVKPLTPSTLQGTVMDLLRPVLARDAPPPGEASDSERELRALLGGRRVLLAEDNVVNLEVAMELLRVVGLEVETVDNGVRAVERALTEPFDLLLMDVQMPLMDGLEAARRIRAQRGPALPIVAVTANAFDGDRDACLAAGMNDCVVKPVQPGQLYEVLRRWLAQAPDRPAPAGLAPPPRPGPEEPALSEALARVEGLDVAAALANLGGRRDAVARVLRRFAKQYRSGVPGLVEAAAGRDASALGAACHALRGACAAIGTTPLAHEIVALESALAADADAPPRVSATARRLEHAVRRLAASIDAALGPG